MQFIGIGISKEDNFRLESLKNDAEFKYSLLIKTLSQSTDSKLKEGLKSFSKAFNLNITQFVDKTDPLYNTSSKINENLVNYFFEKENKIKFLDFLLEKKLILPKKFYLICGDEWYENDDIKLNKIKLSDLYSFFKENNSWYIRLYDYKRDILIPIFYFPVVFEIENDAS